MQVDHFETMPHKRLAKHLKVTISSILSVCMTVLSAGGNAIAQVGRPAAGGTNVLPNCFMGQSGDLLPDAAERAAVSTVALFILDKDHRLVSKDNRATIGSGFVVENSASLFNRHNRIVTATHATKFPPGGAIQVVSSASQTIGLATVVASDGGMSVLEMTSFVNGQQARYDTLGIPLGLQEKHGNLTGIYSKYGGVTHGNSGGPVLDSAGKAIGVVQISFPNGKKLTVSIPPVLKAFLPSTHTLNKVPIVLDQESRGFATSLANPTILNALGKTGGKAHIVQRRSPVPTTTYGFPQGGCAVLTSSMKPLDFATIDDFNFPSSTNASVIKPGLRFQHWNNPQLAATQLKTLLKQAQSILPPDKVLDEVIKIYGPERDISQMNLEGLGKALTNWANYANYIHQPILAQRLADAGEAVDSWTWRSDFQLYLLENRHRPGIAGLQEP